MANYATVKAQINANIKSNNNQEIKGGILNGVLLQMVTTLADGGYLYKGVATPSTAPGTPDANLFYFCPPGEYSNFGTAFTVADGQLGIAAYNGAWSHATIPVGKDYDEILAEKVTEKPGKNLFNPAAPGILVDHYISSSGAMPTSTAGTNVSDYIPVLPETTYHISADADALAGTSYRAFYDSSKTRLSVQAQNANTMTFTTPAQCAFVRVTYYQSAQQVQLEKGVERTYYLAFNPVGGYLSEIFPWLEDLQANKLQARLGTNLWDGTDSITGRYLNASGGTNANSSVNITNYIRVEPNTQYYLSAAGGISPVSSTAMYWHFYTEDKTYISASNSRPFTTPANCYWMRFTHRTDRPEIQLEKGASRSTYQPYTQIGGYYAVLQQKQVHLENLDDAVQDLLGAAVTEFGSFRVSDTVAPSASLTLPTQYCRKNALFVGHIEGTVGTVQMGVGNIALTNYNGYYLELTATNLKLTRMDTGAVIFNEAHGLTLTQHTTLTVDTEIMAPADVAEDNLLKVVIKLSDNLGNTFTKSADNYWGYGQPFIVNANSSGSLGISLSFMPKDELRKIWVFGDSYCEFTYLQKRLPYWLFLNNYSSFLLCAKGGTSQGDHLTAFQNLLALGYKPSYAVWLLGMNDGVDVSTTSINATAKANLDSFLQICTENKITPILQTTPTVPTRQHTALANYVKSLGVRYIDVAGAVGSDSSGNWYPGLLDNDGVHPTSKGSEVIFRQVLLDFPEIGTSC